MTRSPSTCLLAFALLACDVDSDDTSPSQPVRDRDEAPDGAAADAEVARVPVAPRLVTAGWLELADSPIVPWCGAVLIAPDVAVTAARCVAGYDAGFFEVGFGQVSRDETKVAVERVLVQDAEDPEQALAALQLAEPVRGITPVDLSAVDQARICGVQSISYTYALVGETSPRWSWSGCMGVQEDGWLTARNGAPNCHGDMGAGAFLRDGDLVGVVVDARSDGECVRDEKVATVADNAAFFDAALELSGP